MINRDMEVGKIRNLLLQAMVCVNNYYVWEVDLNGDRFSETLPAISKSIRQLYIDYKDLYKVMYD